MQENNQNEENPQSVNNNIFAIDLHNISLPLNKNLNKASPSSQSILQRNEVIDEYIKCLDDKNVNQTDNASKSNDSADDEFFAAVKNLSNKVKDRKEEPNKPKRYEIINKQKNISNNNLNTNQEETKVNTSKHNMELNNLNNLRMQYKKETIDHQENKKNFCLTARENDTCSLKLNRNSNFSNSNSNNITNSNFSSNTNTANNSNLITNSNINMNMNINMITNINNNKSIRANSREASREKNSISTKKRNKTAKNALSTKFNSLYGYGTPNNKNNNLTNVNFKPKNYSTRVKSTMKPNRKIDGIHNYYMNMMNEPSNPYNVNWANKFLDKAYGVTIGTNGFLNGVPIIKLKNRTKLPDISKKELKEKLNKMKYNDIIKNKDSDDNIPTEVLEQFNTNRKNFYQVRKDIAEENGEYENCSEEDLEKKIKDYKNSQTNIEFPLIYQYFDKPKQNNDKNKFYINNYQ